MDERDLALRRLTYKLFVDLGRAPAVDEVAEASGRSPAEVAAGWRSLHDAHALVLKPDRLEIRMANPFSGIPTGYRVQAADRDWFANCAWDAFGVCAALHVDGSIATSCPDCGNPINIRVRNRQPDRGDYLFHCLVPAAHWWDDIIFT